MGKVAWALAWGMQAGHSGLAPAGWPRARPCRHIEIVYVLFQMAIINLHKSLSPSPTMLKGTILLYSCCEQASSNVTSV